MVLPNLSHLSVATKGDGIVNELLGAQRVPVGVQADLPRVVRPRTVSKLDMDGLPTRTGLTRHQHRRRNPVGPDRAPVHPNKALRSDATLPPGDHASTLRTVGERHAQSGYDISLLEALAVLSKPGIDYWEVLCLEGRWPFVGWKRGRPAHSPPLIDDRAWHEVAALFCAIGVHFGDVCVALLQGHSIDTIAQIINGYETIEGASREVLGFFQLLDTPDPWMWDVPLATPPEAYTTSPRLLNTTPEQRMRLAQVFDHVQAHIEAEPDGMRFGGESGLVSGPDRRDMWYCTRTLLASYTLHPQDAARKPRPDQIARAAVRHTTRLLAACARSGLNTSSGARADILRLSGAWMAIGGSVDAPVAFTPPSMSSAPPPPTSSSLLVDPAGNHAPSRYYELLLWILRNSVYEQHIPELLLDDNEDLENPVNTRPYPSTSPILRAAVPTPGGKYPLSSFPFEDPPSQATKHWRLARRAVDAEREKVKGRTDAHLNTETHPAWDARPAHNGYIDSVVFGTHSSTFQRILFSSSTPIGTGPEYDPPEPPAYETPSSMKLLEERFDAAPPGPWTLTTDRIIEIFQNEELIFGADKMYDSLLKYTVAGRNAEDDESQRLIVAILRTSADYFPTVPELHGVARVHRVARLAGFLSIGIDPSDAVYPLPSSAEANEGGGPHHWISIETPAPLAPFPIDSRD